jgi:uncharacterized membrane-anchored protein
VTRRILLMVGAVIVFGVVNWQIAAKERLRAGGQVVLLELRPIDPRSLMQGDYMALNFQLEREISSRISPGDSGERAAIVGLDERRVGRLVRLDDGAPPAPGQMRFRFRMRKGTVWLGTNAFFFHEGEGERYRNSRYGEFRVDDAGNAMLVNLRE